MPGLPSELVKELRSALLECGPFESNAELRRVFAYDRLYPWRHQVPEAASRLGRVEAVLAFLPDKYHERSGNALLAFLEILRGWTQGTAVISSWPAGAAQFGGRLWPTMYQPC